MPIRSARFHLRGGGAGNRYQEAYDRSLFSGPILIMGIDFFLRDNGLLLSGTYNLSFSTITASVNTLSNSFLGNNLGSDNTVFATRALSGVAPWTLTFMGGPFLYNPANGNLLLDITISNLQPSVCQTNCTDAFFADGNGFGPTTIARYSNFAPFGPGYGLVTEFDFTAVPEPGSFSMLGGALLSILTWRLRRS